MFQLRVILIISLGLISLSCSGGNQNMGYWIDDKPLRGTIGANKDYVRPYWECAEKRVLRSSCIERKQ